MIPSTEDTSRDASVTSQRKLESRRCCFCGAPGSGDFFSTTHAYGRHVLRDDCWTGITSLRRDRDPRLRELKAPTRANFDQLAENEHMGCLSTQKLAAMKRKFDTDESNHLEAVGRIRKILQSSRKLLEKLPSVFSIY